MGKNKSFTVTDIQRKKYIAENQEYWKRVGTEFRNRREQNGITTKAVSAGIGCCPKTLSKFEKGEPVKTAAIIENSYDMFLELYRRDREISVDDIVLYLEDTLERYQDLGDAIAENQARTMQLVLAMVKAYRENYPPQVELRQRVERIAIRKICREMNEARQKRIDEKEAERKRTADLF